MPSIEAIVITKEVNLLSKEIILNKYHNILSFPSLRFRNLQISPALRRLIQRLRNF